MTEHLGLEELEASGGLLMTSPLEEPAPAIHHGHGDDVSVHVPAGIAPPAREYSPEEISAMAWKCRMQQSSPDSIRHCFSSFLRSASRRWSRSSGNGRLPLSPRVQPARVTSSFHETRLKHKRKAVQQFVDWVGVRYADSKDCAKMKHGNHTAWLVRLPMFELMQNS